MQNRKKLPYVSVCLAALNVIIFFAMSITKNDTTSGLISYGAITVEAGAYDGGVFPLFAAMFLHFDIYHLGGNMLTLLVVGDLMENRIGKIRFLCTYLAAGLAGNIASIAWYISRGESVVTVGASGAVFGIFAMLLIFAVLDKESIPGFGIGRLAAALFLLVYSSRGADVNDIAHAGGFAVGTIAGLLFQRVWKKNRYL